MTAKACCSNAEAKNLFGMKTGFLEANVEKVLNQYIYILPKRNRKPSLAGKKIRGGMTVPY